MLGWKFLHSISSILVLLQLNAAHWTNGLRLTHMTAPLVADFREPMDLDCTFDMGDEDLYAVKWYKDEHEFFRYIPIRQPPTLSFPVSGVHLISNATNCTLTHCKLRLKDLTRDHSGGAYRCEVSSEAPSFRLVSETHNVTVAAIPRQNPRIESLASSYVEGDTIEAKCISDPADPTPILSWYINGLEAPSRFVGEMTSSEVDNWGLASRSLALRVPAERKYSRGNGIELRCVSSLPGVPLSPQETTLTIPMRRTEAPLLNNEKLHWIDARAGAPMHEGAGVLVVVCVVRWAAFV